LLVYQTSHCLKPLAKIVSGDGQNRWITFRSSSVLVKVVNSLPSNAILSIMDGREQVSVIEHLVLNLLRSTALKIVQVRSRAHVWSELKFASANPNRTPAVSTSKAVLLQHQGDDESEVDFQPVRGCVRVIQAEYFPPISWSRIS
jgi:hypothetical protein